jgi:hypothetical protein
MKLNGKLYLRESCILNILEDIVILLEQGNWNKINTEFASHVKQEHADEVSKKISEFQDMYRVYFKHENYRKLNDVLSMAEENKYDVIKDKVSLFSQGAYGVIVSSEASSIEKFVFNKCVDYFISKLESNYGN